MIIHEVLTSQVPFTSWKHHIVMRRVTDGELPGVVYGGLVEDVKSVLGNAHTEPTVYRVCVQAF